MAEVEIRRVEGSRSREAGEFIRLPKKIYRDSDKYVPWFDRGMRKLFKKDHSFFEHSEGDFFLVRRGTEVLGKVQGKEHKGNGEGDGGGGNGIQDLLASRGEESAIPYKDADNVAENNGSDLFYDLCCLRKDNNSQGQQDVECG